MGIFDTLRKITGFGDNGQDKETSKCMVKIKIRKSEFIVLSKYYYRGYTSYRDIMKYVFMRNNKKTLEVMRSAQKKAESGCIIDKTIIHFYYDNTHFIEIPFDVYSDKRNMSITRRNTKIWNKYNIQRILKLYPEFIEYEKSLISESDIYGLLFEE